MNKPIPDFNVDPHMHGQKWDCGTMNWIPSHLIASGRETWSHEPGLSLHQQVETPVARSLLLCSFFMMTLFWRKANDLDGIVLHPG